MEDARKALDAIKEIVADEVLDQFVRELLENLAEQPEENREWAETVREWLVNEIYGDPGPAES